MGIFNVNPYRVDPYQTFKFRVKWENHYIPGILRVSPLRRVTEPVVHRSGGDPSHSHIAPGITTFEPIVIERGLTHDTSFEQWANLVFNLQGDASMSLKNFRKDIVIELLNHQGKVVMAYHVYRCWVAEYQALSALEAAAPCLAIERLVLQHEGWERDTSVTEPQET
jgi:phage tail-like protein